MSSEGTPPTTPPIETPDIEEILLKVDNPKLTAAVKNMQTDSKAMMLELAEQKKYREDQIKKEGELKQKEYDMNKTEALKELASIKPEFAEQFKDAHLDEIKIRLDQSKKFSNKFPPLNNPANPKEPEKEIEYEVNRAKYINTK